MKHFIICIVIFQSFLYSEVVVDNKGKALQKYRKSKDESTKEGRADALKDIKQGIYRLKIYGLSRSTPYYNYVLKKRYNIIVERVAGCLVSLKLVNHATEYNRIMKIEIKKKFGDDVFLNAKIKARELYEARKDTKNLNQSYVNPTGY